MISFTDQEFKKLTEYIKLHSGIHLKKEKMALLAGRLRSVLQENDFQSFTEYYNYVTSDKSGKALTTLINKVTTNHTYFMREADHFTFLKDKVLPALAQTVEDKDLSIWCAACSTGEESYTLAMVLDEFFGPEKVFWDTKILATDISEHVLNIASRGIYSKENVANLPADWQKKYFVKYDAESFIVKPKIRNEVIYRKFNLIEPFPFKRKFHIIFCRNVMIYFDKTTKEELVKKFYNYLEDGGYLFIGHSETLNRERP